MRHTIARLLRRIADRLAPQFENVKVTFADDFDGEAVAARVIAILKERRS